MQTENLLLLAQLQQRAQQQQHERQQQLQRNTNDSVYSSNGSLSNSLAAATSQAGSNSNHPQHLLPDTNRTWASAPPSPLIADNAGHNNPHRQQQLQHQQHSHHHNPNSLQHPKGRSAASGAANGNASNSSSSGSSITNNIPLSELSIAVAAAEASRQLRCQLLTSEQTPATPLQRSSSGSPVASLITAPTPATLSTAVIRLNTRDMSLYGISPATDHFRCAVCTLCTAVVHPAALLRHMQLQHRHELHAARRAGAVRHTAAVAANASTAYSVAKASVWVAAHSLSVHSSSNNSNNSTHIPVAADKPAGGESSASGSISSSSSSNANSIASSSKGTSSKHHSHHPVHASGSQPKHHHHHTGFVEQYFLYPQIAYHKILYLINILNTVIATNHPQPVAALKASTARARRCQQHRHQHLQRFIITITTIEPPAANIHRNRQRNVTPGTSTNSSQRHSCKPM